ncbi:Aste57867_3185 [Aphanomyces stellatus]|uniref:Aste57867_3185 protein n=1 Tax=Aphanomyces stellatus TaxID=120398 RepID=A0A485KCZ8_9STRA|nr:hypothetical protein As57867_003176 [Aphanomyces stellatus]VFT80359.1 Aste57867_3185 [Aphanomyces stellatus]
MPCVVTTLVDKLGTIRDTTLVKSPFVELHHFQPFAQNLPYWPSLTHLSIVRSSLTSHECNALALVLPRTSIVCLNLSGNLICNNGAGSLLAQRKKSLRRLNLDNNKLTISSTIALVAFALSDTKMFLSLQNNPAWGLDKAKAECSRVPRASSNLCLTFITFKLHHYIRIQELCVQGYL